MARMVTVRNTLNGVVAEAPECVLTDPHFSKFYVEVEPGAKDALPEMFTPRVDGVPVSEVAGEDSVSETAQPVRGRRGA